MSVSKPVVLSRFRDVPVLCDSLSPSFTSQPQPTNNPFTGAALIYSSFFHSRYSEYPRVGPIRPNGLAGADHAWLFMELKRRTVWYRQN